MTYYSVPTFGRLGVEDHEAGLCGVPEARDDVAVAVSVRTHGHHVDKMHVTVLNIAARTDQQAKTSETTKGMSELTHCPLGDVVVISNV